MKSLRDMPVSRKLAVIITITTTTSLLFIALAFSAYDYGAAQRDDLDRLTTLGRIVADNSTAAVAFNDSKAATEVLSTLQEEPEIQNACTYDSSRTLLAEYHRGGEWKCPASNASTTGAMLVSPGAVYNQPILLHNAPAGYVYLVSDLAEMRARRQHFAAITLEFLFAALIAAVLLGSLLQRWITQPIVDLAKVMQKVTGSRDYSLRARFQAGDEVGKLVAGFNEMLGEIETSHARLEEQALNDDLTGLPNRRLLADRLAHALDDAKRRNTKLGLIYLDLDGFKLVNDTFGHSTGDVLLRQVADRLRKRIRAADTLARIGGDEFTVVLTDIADAEGAGLVAADLLREMATPFLINDKELVLSASLGISLYPKDGSDAEQLIQQADTAMYVAKGNGKNRFTFFTPEFGDAVRERLQLEHELRGAIERGELEVHYQPEFKLEANQLVRFEALARWRHPTLGMIPPSKFIPVAEESGLIVSIGMWVMEKACREARSWQALSPAPVQVAVNVSVAQVIRDDFAEQVGAILERTGLNATLLQIELTESVLMPAIYDLARGIAELRARGVTVAIDDFGSGYSSLSYLPRLPFDFLKIDRTFLKNITESDEPEAMMQAIVELAHSLKMAIIAEGVETSDQCTLIRKLGCDEVQGYLFGRPTSDPVQYLLEKQSARGTQECVRDEVRQVHGVALGTADAFCGAD